jgi:hypothetical protein
MTRPSIPSSGRAPAPSITVGRPSPPSPHGYLGRGGSEGPVKLQFIVALVAGLILIAVPLYLWRRPHPEPIPSADAAVASTAAPVPASTVVAFDVGATSISLSPFTTLRCDAPDRGKTPPERCDHVTAFEHALARAIRESGTCAAASKTPFAVSFVLETDFRRRTLQLFAGKSSSLPRKKARELVRCVRRAMPSPDWGAIPHQYGRYRVKVVATYPPGDSF